MCTCRDTTLRNAPQRNINEKILTKRSQNKPGKNAVGLFYQQRKIGNIFTIIEINRTFCCT